MMISKVEMRKRLVVLLYVVQTYMYRIKRIHVAGLP